MKKIKEKLKKTSKFKSEKDEQEFWEKNDSTEYVDWKKAEKVTFPNLKPSTETISLRLPKWLLDDIKNSANEIDVPYQSYIKTILAEAVV